MSMSAAGLAAAITSAQGPAENTAIQQAANLALATGIINYLISSAVVTVTIEPSTIATPGFIGPPNPVDVTGGVS